MILVLIIILAFTAYYFYYEKIVRPKLDMEEKKRDDEYFKISLMLSNHPLMRDKLKKFVLNQKNKINEESFICRTSPSEVGRDFNIFSRTIRIHNDMDAARFKGEIISTFNKLNSDESQAKLITKIIEDYHDHHKKKIAHRNIDINSFHLLYLNHKHLLDSIFPDRRINSTTFENYTTKSKEEIIDEIVISDNISEEEAFVVFDDLTSIKFGNRILGTIKGKYYLDDEKTLFDY